MKHARPDYNRIQDPAGKIPVNEPVFLLRAQDATAARVVRFWAQCQVEAGNVDPDIIEAARGQAVRMEEWPTKKAADLSAPEKKFTPQEFQDLCDPLGQRLREVLSDAREAGLELTTFVSIAGHDFSMPIGTQLFFSLMSTCIDHGQKYLAQIHAEHAQVIVIEKPAPVPAAIPPQAQTSAPVPGQPQEAVDNTANLPPGLPQTA